MRTIKHPLSGALYDLTDTGTVLVQKDGATGEFTSEGRYITGTIKQCDPHICVWIAGRQVHSNPRAVAQSLIDDKGNT
jgi:hypothetical protein